MLPPPPDSLDEEVRQRRQRRRNDRLPPPPDDLGGMPPPPMELGADEDGSPPPPAGDPAAREQNELTRPSKAIGLESEDKSTEDQQFEMEFRQKLITKLAEQEKALREKVETAARGRTKVEIDKRTGRQTRVEPELTDEQRRLKERADTLRERRMSLTQQLEEVSKQDTGVFERAGDAFEKSYLNMANIVNNISNWAQARQLENFKKVDSGQIDPYFLPEDSRLRQYAEADEEGKQQMKRQVVDNMSSNTAQIIENRNKTAELYENPMTKAMVQADSFEEAFDFFMANPIDAITGLSAESSLQMVPGMAIGALGAATGGTAPAFLGFALGSGSVEFGAALGDKVLEKANEDDQTNIAVNQMLAEQGLISEGTDGIGRLQTLKEYQEDVVSVLPDMPEDTRQSIFSSLREQGLVGTETVDGQQVERFEGKPEQLLQAIAENPKAQQFLAENLPADKYEGINPGDLQENLKQFDELSGGITSLLKDPDSVLRQKVLNVLQDEEAMSDASQYAATRGGVIGVAEGLSAVIPGSQVAKQIGKARAAARMLGQTKKISLGDKARIAGGIALASGMDAAGGGIGEAGAQIATGEDINAGEIMAEAVPEFIGAPAEITSTAYGLARTELTPGEQELLNRVRKEREMLNVPFRSQAEEFVTDVRRTQQAEQMAEEGAPPPNRPPEAEPEPEPERTGSAQPPPPVADTRQITDRGRELVDEVDSADNPEVALGLRAARMRQEARLSGIDPNGLNDAQLLEELRSLATNPEPTPAPETTAETDDLGTPAETVMGEPTFRDGLAIAAKNPDGTVFVGTPAHATLINEFDTQIDIGQAEMGFYTEDGRFLSRTEAKEFIDRREGRAEAEPAEETAPEPAEQVETTRLQPASTANPADIQAMRDRGFPESAIEQFEQPDVLADQEGNAPQTGAPITVEAYQGINRDTADSIYEEGAEGAILGEAGYYAMDSQTAERFGDEVVEREVTLQNPLVITSDRELARWMMGDENAAIPSTNEERSARIQEFRQRVEDAGHDGVVVNVPKSSDVNQQGESAKRLREVFGDTQVVEFETRQPEARQRSGLRSTVLFGEDIAGPDTTPTQPAETAPAPEPVEVLDGAYNVAFEADGITVVNNETGQPVSRQSNNWNDAVAEAMIAHGEQRGEPINDENFSNVRQYLEAVYRGSNTPVEVVEAYLLARTMVADQMDTESRQVIQQFFAGGGQIRPADITEYADRKIIQEAPKLRIYTNNQATPLDIQAEILSREAGREITPVEIIEYMIDEFSTQTRQTNIDRQLAEAFFELTGETLTEGLANATEAQLYGNNVTAEGAILPQVSSLLDEYFNADGTIDYQRLWDEALSQDQQKDFFTTFPGELTEAEYQQLKQEVQDATTETTSPTEEEATGAEPAPQEGQAEGTETISEAAPELGQTQITEAEPDLTPRRPPGTLYGEANAIISRERAQQARENLRRGLGGSLNIGIDPSLLKDMMELAMFHLEAGSRKFADFANAMVADLGERVKPYLRPIYNQAKARANDIPREEFSSDEEVLRWQEENLSDNEQINSVSREFWQMVNRQQAQGYKDTGRPDLANPVNDQTGRQAVDYIDEQRKDAGIPSPRSDRSVAEEARRRLDADYEGEKARLFDLAQDYNAGMWSDVDVKMAKIIMGRESQQALSANDKAQLYQFFLMTGIYRDVGTEQARAFRMRRDDSLSPAERKAEMIRDVFEDTKATLDVVTKIHQLAQQAQRGELTKQEFRQAVLDVLGAYTAQGEKSSIQTWIDELFGRKPTSAEIDELFEATKDGATAVQDALNKLGGKMNLPKLTIGLISRLENFIERVESAPMGRPRNQALLELLEFIEDSNILGGRFSRGLRAAIDDILNRQHEVFESYEDILTSVRDRVMENVTQALLTPPKEVIQAMRQAESAEERQQIWDDYYERFQSIKDALLNEDGIDIENLSRDDIADPVLMNTILRKFQAANGNWDSKMYEFWNNAILSNFTTHAVNISGNALNLFYQSVPVRFWEAFVNTFARDPDSAQWGELKYFFKGFLTYIPEAIKYAQLAFQTETRLFAEEIGLERGVGKFQDKMQEGVAIKGKKGRFVRAFGWRPLTAMDEFFKVVAFRAQLAAEAYREAKRQGMEGEQVATFIERNQANPTGAVAESAWGWALESVFQEDPGAITGAFIKLQKSHELVKYAFPFVRTPGNLLKQGIRKGPLGALNIVHRATMATAYKMQLTKDSKWTYSKTEVTKHMAEQFTFWTALAGIGALFKSGEDEDGLDPRPLITGSGASYRDESQFRYQQQNYPPQSFRIPGTDRYYSYRRFDPFASTIAMTVDAIEAIEQAQSGREIMDVANDYFEKNLRLLSDKSYFQFVGDFVRFTQYPASGATWIGNFGASWMPNIIKHQMRAQDDYVREYTKGDRARSVKEFTGVVIEESGQRAFPVPSAQPPPRVDWLGKPIRKDEFGGATQTYLYRVLSPALTIDRPPSAYDEMIMNWNNQNPNDKWFPTVPRDKVTINGKTLELDRTMYFEYVARRGFHTQQLLDENFHEFNIFLPSQENIDKVQSIQQRAGRIAKQELLQQGVFYEPFE